MGSVRLETTFEFLLFPIGYALFQIFFCCMLSIITTADHHGLLSQAKQMISLLCSTSISIATLTFSLTVLSIQIAAQTYSPRLLDDFLKDPVSKIAVAVNLGSYSFAFTLTYFVNDSGKAPNVAIQFLSVALLRILSRRKPLIK